MRGMTNPRVCCWRPGKSYRGERSLQGAVQSTQCSTSLMTDHRGCFDLAPSPLIQ